MFLARFAKVSRAFRPIPTVSQFFHTSKPLLAPQRDFYDVLGVSRGASQTEIKHSYYKLAQQYHPDKNPSPSAKEKFAEINNAYETLSDDKKRNVYDTFGMTGDEQDQAGGADPFTDFFGGGRRGAGGFHGGFEGFDAGDIFGDMFGGGMPKKENKRGKDIHLNIEINFDEAINGVKKEMKYDRKAQCSTCKGTKCAPGHKPIKCKSCNGKGTESVRQGPVVIEMSCPKCKGEGKVIKNPCNTCRGKGVGQEKHREQVSIPKGVQDGQTVQVKGMGNVGEQSGKDGDLIIKVAVKPHTYFRRDGYDIYSDAFINISQAVLGTTLQVETIDGVETVKVEKGTQHGDRIKIANKGVTKLPPHHFQRGDHVIDLKVVIPKKVSDEEVQLFKKLSETEEDLNQVELAKQNAHKYKTQSQAQGQQQEQKKKSPQESRAERRRRQQEEEEDDDSDDDSDGIELDEEQAREMFEQMFGGGRGGGRRQQY